MKITGATSEVFEWERPGIWNGGHFYGPGRLHKVTVTTDEGITGYGWNGGTAAERPMEFLPLYVDYFRPLLIGRDPMDTRGIAVDLGEKLIKILGPAGLNTQALAAINIACWDIKGKALGQSVHRLLGGAQDRIRTYIAGGYYAEGKGLEELKNEVRFNVEELHAGAVKIKIGDPSVGVAGDIQRVAAARDAIGDSASLLVDANCALDLSTAMEFARQLPEYDGLLVRGTPAHTRLRGPPAAGGNVQRENRHRRERLPPGPLPHSPGTQRRLHSQRRRRHRPRLRCGQGRGRPRRGPGRLHRPPRLPGAATAAGSGRFPR